VAPPPITADDPLIAVQDWFQLMTLYCSTVDYDSARQIFAGDVASFGTYADAVRGLDRLQKEQWEQVWPRTSGFRVLMDSVFGGGDAHVAWGMATWESTGYDEGGGEFLRRGRATTVLVRSNDRWAAVHTHFSLFPDTP
jgi:ketosteroid isomerase-like protein